MVSSKPYAKEWIMMIEGTSVMVATPVLDPVVNRMDMLKWFLTWGVAVRYVYAHRRTDTAGLCRLVRVRGAPEGDSFIGAWVTEPNRTFSGLKEKVHNEPFLIEGSSTYDKDEIAISTSDDERWCKPAKLLGLLDDEGEWDGVGTFRFAYILNGPVFVGQPIWLHNNHMSADLAEGLEVERPGSFLISWKENDHRGNTRVWSFCPGMSHQFWPTVNYEQIKGWLPIPKTEGEKKVEPSTNGKLGYSDDHLEEEERDDEDDDEEEDKERDAAPVATSVNSSPSSSERQGTLFGEEENPRSDLPPY